MACLERILEEQREQLDELARRLQSLETGSNDQGRELRDLSGEIAEVQGAVIALRERLQHVEQRLDNPSGD